MYQLIKKQFNIQLDYFCSWKTTEALRDFLIEREILSKKSNYKIKKGAYKKIIFRSSLDNKGLELKVTFSPTWFSSIREPKTNMKAVVAIPTSESQEQIDMANKTLSALLEYKI